MGISAVKSTLERSGVKRGLKAEFLFKEGRSSTGTRHAAPGRTANGVVTSKKGMKTKSGVHTLEGGGSVGPKGQLRTSNGITEEGITSAGCGKLNVGLEETGMSSDGFGDDGPSAETLYEELLYGVGTFVGLISDEFIKE